MLKRTSLFITVASIATILAGSAIAAPFGNAKDTTYATKLWQALSDNRLVGTNAFRTRPYDGTAPHGAVLETIDGNIKVGSYTGQAIVKKNFGGKGVDIDAVANDPNKYLKSITVMFKRDKGYDPQDNNWFWAKFMPSGKLLKNPAKMALAGRIGKGSNKGCIACHTGAPGGDLVFNNDR